MLDKYCVTCHNERSKRGGLVLDTLDPAQAAAHADVWEKVVRKLHAGVDAAGRHAAAGPRADVGCVRHVARGVLDDAAAAEAESRPRPPSIA